jgi:uncharacterized membrane protein YedE/YeeE
MLSSLGSPAGAVIVAAIGYRLTRLLLDCRFGPPSKSAFDALLLHGSAICGIGWEITGGRPAPAIASLMLGIDLVALIVATMRSSG